MKPLKILLGNNTLSLLAGSETWTYTLAIQLKAMGHFVACYAPELGIISDKLRDAGIPSYSEISTDGIQPFNFVLNENVKHEYDVIIANHFHVVEYLRSVFPKTPIISTIHGIIHKASDGSRAPEHPALNSGVSQFVAVSEEVQELLQRDYGIESVIVRNFFDLSRYKNLKPAADRPRQFLINTNYNGKDDEVVANVREAAKKLGAKVAAVGVNFTQQFDLTRAIEDSDVVFGMGRSVLEGVAAGRLGIVHGRWGTGGAIDGSHVNNLRRCNFSGRNAEDGKVLTADEIVELVQTYYTRDRLDWGKTYMGEHHNVVFAAEAYVRLARECTGELITRPVASGVDPEARPFRRAE